jgi:hypothetical protein
MVEAGVVLLSFSPWKSRVPLRPDAGGSPLPPFGRELFIDAHASIMVPCHRRRSGIM